jgi:death on curing protein
MTGPDRAEPVWLDANDALAIHDRQLAEHGGAVGVRDMALLDSALARPINRWNYGDDNPADLAASYAFGVARNHPFIDGNKRTAWVLARLFLAINDQKLSFDKVNATQIMIALAAGELTEAEMAHWFRAHLAP